MYTESNKTTEILRVIFRTRLIEHTGSTTAKRSFFKERKHLSTHALTTKREEILAPLIEIRK